MSSFRWRRIVRIGRALKYDFIRHSPYSLSMPQDRLSAFLLALAYKRICPADYNGSDGINRMEECGPQCKRTQPPLPLYGWDVSKQGTELTGRKAKRRRELYCNSINGDCADNDICNLQQNDDIKYKDSPAVPQDTLFDCVSCAVSDSDPK